MRKKKSQVSHTIFYVFGIIVAALLLTAGLRSLSHLSEQRKQLLLTQFEQTLKKDVERLASRYGYLQTLTYDLPSTYKKACFLDLTQQAILTQSPSLTEYSALHDAATTRSLNNVFLMGNDVAAYAVPNLSLTAYPYYACQEIQNGHLELTLEGAGRKTLVLTNLTTTLHLDATQEQHLFSADGFVELILPPGVTVTPAVPDLFIQIVPPTYVTSPHTKKTEVYHFGPEDTHFSPAATLHMRYFPPVLGMECPSQLTYHTFHEDGTPKKDYPSTQIDCEHSVATFQIDGFSSGFIGEAEACDLSCFAFSSCTSTGAQARLCANPNNCPLDLTMLTDLINQPCFTLPESCTDNLLNQDETDTDCGGTICGKCSSGKTCDVNTDCLSDQCVEGLCQTAPSCTDGMKNSDETDVDCGGSCDTCPDGKNCQTPDDCQSNNCVNGVCQLPVGGSCTDGLQNQDETDVDCGGSCDPCPDGKSCGKDKDCEHLYCQNLECVSCVDLKENQDETDVDCGGMTCDLCAEGKKCNSNNDCQNNNCVGGLCQTILPPSCTDGSKNGQETDIDCGGTVCMKCMNGKMCVVSGDCASNNCVGGTCQMMPSCTDGIKNQDESDVDCGGIKCSKCSNGKKCVTSIDCTSNNCVGGTCQVMPGCTDGIKNNQETDIDCGGSTCPKCADQGTCVVALDCQSNQCEAGKCVSCFDSLKNQDETDVDCGGTICDPCPEEGCTETPGCDDECMDKAVGQPCDCSGECTTNNCAGGICQASASSETCTDLVKNQGEGDVDCGGPCVTKCANDKTCNAGTDCQSNNCVNNLCKATTPPSATLTFRTDKAKDGTARASSASTTNRFTIAGNNNGVVRGFLYFDTSSLPDTSTINNAKLTVKGYNLAKNNCKKTGNIDIYRCNYSPLDKNDFNACTPGTKNTAFIDLLETGWKTLSVTIDPGLINKQGPTQFKLKSQYEGCTTGAIKNYARLCGDTIPKGSCLTDNDRHTLEVTYTG